MEAEQTIALRDESVYPDSEVLQNTLGPSLPAYYELLALYDRHELSYEWRYYKDGKAWLCKVQKNKKTVVWMSAWKGYIQATIYFPEKYIEHIYTLDIREDRKTKIRQAKNSGKSKPCTFEIREPGDLEDFEKVMEFKMSLK